LDIASEITGKYQAIFDSLPKGKGNLRFGRNIVSVSLIAKQYYCEKTLELDFEHPAPPTEIMQKGKEGHDSVTALAEPVAKEKAVADAVKKREKPVCIYEFGVAWKHEGVPIIGHVDEAWFRGGGVDLVVERKFSDSLQVYSGYHIQAQLYCLGLGEMGFNNSSAEYNIMVFKRKCYECPKLAENTCPILVPELEIDSYQCENGRVHSYLYVVNQRNGTLFEPYTLT
jgi:hypothetical protein